MCLSCVIAVYVRFIARCFFFQAEDGIRDLVRSRGLGDVYKRQVVYQCAGGRRPHGFDVERVDERSVGAYLARQSALCLLYTSDAADERSSVDLGGRRIIKKKTKRTRVGGDKRSIMEHIDVK